RNWRFRFLHLIDARRPWALLQTPAQGVQLLARSLREHLHRAVRVVANPSRDAQKMRLALYKPAEADPLHTPAHEEPPRFDFGMVSIGRHGSRELRASSMRNPNSCPRFAPAF